MGRGREKEREGGKKCGLKVFHGSCLIAQVCHVISDPSEPDVSCVLEIAKKHNQALQVVSSLNDALNCRP